MTLRIDWKAVSREYLVDRAARGDARAAGVLRGLVLEGRRGGEQTTVAGNTITRVVVGVCTARRPRMLRHCVEAIASQIVPERVELHLVVVDNEMRPNNRRLVKHLAAQCPFSVHYIHQPVRGIPQARNAVLEMCQHLQAHWIAFTDDDCWARPDWIASLLEAACRHQADVVYGRREFVLPPTYWAVQPKQPTYGEGQRLRRAATHNVLLAGWLIADGKDGCLRFDEALAHGEDTDFFYRASLRGARVVYSHAPVVFELVPLERATLSRQSRRAYYYAASRSYFHRRHNGALRALLGVGGRVVLKMPTALAKLSVAPLVRLFDEQAFKSLVLEGAGRLAGVAGAMAGLLGRLGDPYKAIE